LFQDCEKDKIVVCPLYTGPWEFHEQLFTLKEEIYLSKDVFYFKEETHKKLANILYESMKSIAENVNDSFVESDPSSIWDLFLINYEIPAGYDNLKHPTFESTGKSVRDSNSKSNSFPNDIVNNMMLIVLNCQGKACEDNCKDEKDETPTAQQHDKNLLKSKSKLKGEKKENLSDAFKSMKEEKFSNRLQTVNNILKKLESTYFRDKFEKEEDRIKGTSNLPFSYVVEMIKDLNDVLILYKENLFSQVSKALYVIQEP